ncbi:carbohydrate ABC transporter membrane protein 2, CUT1 family (TC 3.A.1.1.-) [Arthrobacter sp. 31Cvi3.1E]|nr:carbohydrate ABC transporter membrane protein 2, CUT1 family (TC 3.A.1.1.-) [Arthrobacter sp. 31Cvi3.1E]
MTHLKLPAFSKEYPVSPDTPTSRPVSKPRKPFGPRVVTAAVYAVLILLAIAVLYPLLWMFTSAMKTSAEIFSNPWALPTSLDFTSFGTAWQQGVVKFVLNSVLVTVVSLVLTLGISSAAAYGLTKLRMPFAKTATFLLLGALMVSPTTALVPLFQLLQLTGLYDTHLGLIILYVAYRLPFTIFLIRAYMITLPADLEDATVIDGASRFQAFRLVILPLTKPALISAGLVNVLHTWNEFPFALIFLNNPALKTLPVGLLDLKSAVQTDWPVLFAGLSLAALPMIIAFVLGQRHFIRGLADGIGK